MARRALTGAAIISGGASGLGAATAEALIAEGMAVLLADVNEEVGKATAERLGTLATFRRTDVTDPDDVQVAVNEAAALHEDGLRDSVACAGIGVVGRILSKRGPHDPGAFRKTIEVNLLGTFHLLLAAAQAMVENEPIDGERGMHVEHRVGRGVRRADRAGRLLGVEGRHRRDDAPGRARPRAARHPRQRDRAGHLRHADGGRAARRRPRVAGEDDAVPAAPRAAGGVRAARRRPRAATATSTRRPSASTRRCALPLGELDADGRALLFRSARSANKFTDTPVTDEKLRDIYELFHYAPTQSNTNPLRILLVQSPEARERLLPHMSEGNRDKTATAPATAVLAADLDFHEFIPQLFPTRAHARERYAGDPDLRERHARFNASLQAAYFMLAVRAAGLAAGPDGGFDAAGVDGEFFADTTWRSLCSS